VELAAAQVGRLRRRVVHGLLGVLDGVFGAVSNGLVDEVGVAELAHRPTQLDAVGAVAVGDLAHRPALGEQVEDRVPAAGFFDPAQQVEHGRALAGHVRGSGRSWSSERGRGLGTASRPTRLTVDRETSTGYRSRMAL